MLVGCLAMRTLTGTRAVTLDQGSASPPLGSTPDGIFDQRDCRGDSAQGVLAASSRASSTTDASLTNDPTGDYNGRQAEQGSAVRGSSMMDATRTIRVRPAMSGDLQAIGRLGALLVRLHHEFDPRRFIEATPQTEHGYASYLGRQLDEKSVVLLVTERDGAVLAYSYAGVEGYDYMSLRGPAGVLYDIVVDPAHRGRGVGRLLLDATLAALESHGAPRVVLSTAEKNESAQRLFARAGFRPTMIEMTRELGV